MTTDVLYFLLGVAGAVIMLAFGIIGYFLKIVHNDAKQAVIDGGKNKGAIELIKLQLDSDVKRIEQLTQLELRNLAVTVSKLSTSVEQLVKIQLEDKRDTHQ
jgi:hypothetical protein